MTRLTTLQSNLESGELDPTLRGRTDLKAYRNGAKRMRNTQRRATGGAERRFGTYDAAALAGRARLAEFEFSDSQRYVLAFAHEVLHIFDLNGTLLQTIVSCPWSVTQAFELTYSQSADVMIVAHQGFSTRVLRRTGATTFTLDPIAFDVSVDGHRIWQPYFKFAAANVTLTPSAATGAITLTSSAAFFTAAMVGLALRIYDCEVTITGYTSPTVVNATVKGKLEGQLDLDPLKTLAGSNVIEVTHVFHGLTTGATITLSGCNSVGHVPGDQIDGARVVTVLDEHRYSIAPVLSYPYDDDGDSSTPPVTKTTAVTSEDGGGANVRFNVAGTPTRTWAEPAISVVRGYPGACCFHEGRLWLASTPSQPDTLFASKALSPFNFDVGEGNDGDSVQVASGTEDVSRIRHVVSNGDLQLFTPTRESIFLTRDGEAITPGNSRIKAQSVAGSGGVQPVVFDGATLFVQENGLSVSELVYAESQGGYIATAVSTLAGHLIAAPVSIAVSPGTTNRAEQQAFVVNADGTVAVFHSLRAENIAGWQLWELGAGLVHSVCTVGPQVYFAVEVRGAHRLYRLADNDLACLDGQVHHVAGPATTTWTLDARVRNREVGIRSEYGYHGTFEIDGTGALTLPVAVTNVVAGDPFVFEIETLPPVVQLPAGERTGLIQRIVRSVIDVDETEALTVEGRRIETRDAGDDFAGAVRAVTGPMEVRHLGFSRAPTITLSQEEPLPARILSILLEVKV